MRPGDLTTESSALYSIEHRISSLIIKPSNTNGRVRGAHESESEPVVRVRTTSAVTTVDTRIDYFLRARQDRAIPSRYERRACVAVAVCRDNADLQLQPRHERSFVARARRAVTGLDRSLDSRRARRARLRLRRRTHFENQQSRRADPSHDGEAVQLRTCPRPPDR